MPVPDNGLSKPLVLFVVLLASPAFARLGNVCVKAASSNDGRFLVVSERQTEPIQGEPVAHKIIKQTFQVFPAQELLRYNLKMPITAWHDLVLWQVELEPNDERWMFGCLVPLLNGAEYLVLLNDTDGVNPRNIAMLVYRAPSRTEPNRAVWGRGVLVRQLTARDIWPGHKFTDETVTDGTPSWFEGGTFEWGKDNHSLLYKTRWGDDIHIDLNTGSVSKEPPVHASRPNGSVNLR